MQLGVNGPTSRLHKERKKSARAKLCTYSGPLCLPSIRLFSHFLTPTSTRSHNGISLMICYFLPYESWPVVLLACCVACLLCCLPVVLLACCVACLYRSKSWHSSLPVEQCPDQRMQFSQFLKNTNLEPPAVHGPQHLIRGCNLHCQVLVSIYR